MSSTISLKSMAPNIVSPSPNKSKAPSKKKSTSLPAETVDYLKAWMMSPEHIAHPYPTEQEKAQIMSDTGIELKQLTNWFVNNRKRYWKPRVEARLQQQVQLPVAPQGPPVNKRRASVQQLSTIDLIDRNLLAPSISVSSKPTDNFKSMTRDSFTASAPFVRVVSSQGLVSDASNASSSASCASGSDSGSVFSSSNEDDMTVCESVASVQDEITDGTVHRSENVDVHILRPLNGVKPTIADVSILSTVPTERILQTYENRSLTYRFAAETVHDRKKIQSRRDGEVVRLKRRYLKLYLDEQETTQAFQVIKRTCDEVVEVEESPRKRFCIKSPTTWKEACKAAEDLYDTDLPTLEEATLLFGFSRGFSY